MIGRLLVRLVSAAVIFMFLCLVTLILGDLIVPGQNDTDAPDSPAELEEGLALLESSEMGGMGTLVVIMPIVLLAGFSDAIGHSAILFANRVKPSRFALTILVNTVLFVVGYLIWVGMVALVSLIVFNRDAAFVRAAFAVGGSYVPLVYGFLIALPYIGVLIANILHLLTAIVLVQNLQVVFPYTLPQAVLCAAISLVAVIGFRLTVGRPIDWVSGKLRNVVAGTALKRSINDALAYVESKRTQS